MGRDEGRRVGLEDSEAPMTRTALVVTVRELQMWNIHPSPGNENRHSFFTLCPEAA